mgnify:CR=1 FL=1
MTTHQDFLSLVDTRSQRRRPPVVGMQFLHERAMSGRDFVTRGALLKPQDFISFILGHRASDTVMGRLAAPRIRVTLACLTPTGKAAVKINL